MNEQSRVQCGTNYIDVYIQRVKTIWKFESEEQVNITNSQKVKWFFWHVSTLFKDLRLVVSIRTSLTFTSLNSIEGYFFSYKVFLIEPMMLHLWGQVS
jgi:hypothetical protein